MAKLTHSISVFTEGILMMKTTLVGIIKVNYYKKKYSTKVMVATLLQILVMMHNFPRLNNY